MTDNTQTPAEADQGPDLAEGYPTLAKILKRISEDPDIPDVGVRRVEVNAFASGEATYQVWAVDAEEAVGGYIDNL